MQSICSSSDDRVGRRTRQGLSTSRGMTSMASQHMPAAEGAQMPAARSGRRGHSKRSLRHGVPPMNAAHERGALVRDEHTITPNQLASSADFILTRVPLGDTRRLAVSALKTRSIPTGPSAERGYGACKSGCHRCDLSPSLYSTSSPSSSSKSITLLCVAPTNFALTIPLNGLLVERATWMPSALIRAGGGMECLPKRSI